MIGQIRKLELEIAGAKKNLNMSKIDYPFILENKMDVGVLIKLEVDENVKAISLLKEIIKLQDDLILELRK